MNIETRDFRKKFKEKYYKNYDESAPIKKPRLYTALLVGVLFFLTMGLILHILYFVFGFTYIYLVCGEFASYMIAGIIWKIGDSKNVCKDYKRKLLEKSLNAIDKTFDDEWHPKDLYCREKCIDLFKQDYSKSWGYLLSKIINKTVAVWLTILFSLITYICPGVHDVESPLAIWFLSFFL